MNNNKLIKVIFNINKEIIEKEEYLKELDNKTGDGDHGSNMKRGFSFVIQALEKEDKPQTLKDTFSLMGNILMAKVGGISGLLYGQMFIKGSSKFIDITDINYAIISQFINEASAILQKLGTTQLNDKTMYDVWGRCAQDFNDKKTLQEIISNIVVYRDQTQNIAASSRKAGFLKDASSGTIDPGSASSEIILRHLLEGIL